MEMEVNGPAVVFRRRAAAVSALRLKAAQYLNF